MEKNKKILVWLVGIFLILFYAFGFWFVLGGAKYILPPP